MKLIMNHLENKTGLLWKSFMPLRNSVPHKVNNLLYSLQVFPSGYFNQFNPATYFEKWALVEVSSWNNLPEGMEKFELQGGSFAVFQHKGMDPSIFNYIYSEWLLNSAFQLDDRPHFEILEKNIETETLIRKKKYGYPLPKNKTGRFRDLLSSY